jgi:hypothetical protein
MTTARPLKAVTWRVAPRHHRCRLSDIKLNKRAISVDFGYPEFVYIPTPHYPALM